MHLNDLLAELGKNMGIPSLKLDENNVCRLVFDKKMTVDMEASSDGKKGYIYSVVCPIPIETVEKEKLFDALMEANLFGHGTGGSTFAADITAKEILFCRTLEIDKVNFTEFANVLEVFLNNLEIWLDKIKQGSYSETNARAETSASSSEKEDLGEFFTRV